MNKSCKFKKVISLTVATGILLTSSVSIGCFAEAVESNDVKIEKVLDEATKEAATGSSLAKFVEAVTEAFGKFKKGASSTHDSLKNKANDLRKGGKTENDQYWEGLAGNSGAANGTTENDGFQNKTFAEFILWLRTRAKDSKVNKYFNYLADGLEKLANNWKVTAGVSLGVAGAAVVAWLGKKALSGGFNATDIGGINYPGTNLEKTGNVNYTTTLDNQIPESNSNITISEGFTLFKETYFDKIRNKINGGAFVAVVSFIVGILTLKWCLPNKLSDVELHALGLGK